MPINTYCDNPIQLKALYPKNNNSPRPYGSHVGKPLPGFAFDTSLDGFCPYQMMADKPRKSDRRSVSKLGQELIDLMIQQFDRIIYTLQADLGFWPSDNLAGKMLKQWFSARACDYTGAHPGNLPWMLAYFSENEDLYGQRIGQNEALSKAISEKIPSAILTDQGKLLRKDDQPFFRIEMQFLYHRSEKQPDESLQESLRFRVQDFTHVNEA